MKFFRSQKSRSITSLIIAILGVVIFSITISRAVIYEPEAMLDNAGLPAGHDQSAQTAPNITPYFIASTSPNDFPIRLTVPALEIDAKVQRIGLARSGNIGIPNNFTDVGWYKYGAIPGERGTALIDGHVDNGLGLAGVFKNLSQTKQGMDIYVDMNSGLKLHFKVSDITVVDYRTKAGSVLSNSGQAKLALITCDGLWIPSEKTYDRRLVITAELVR